MSIEGMLKRKIRGMLGWSVPALESEWDYPPVEIDLRSCTFVKPSRIGDTVRISVRINSQDCILIDRFLGPNIPSSRSSPPLGITRGIYGVIHILDVPRSKTLFNRLEVVISEFTSYRLRSDRSGWFLVEQSTDMHFPVPPGASIEINGYPVN